MLADTDKIARYPATAHIPGAIPEKTCGDCQHLIPCKDKARGRCIEHFRFRGLAYLFLKPDKDWWRGLATIEAATLACKYFLQKEPAPNPLSGRRGAGRDAPTAELTVVELEPRLTARGRIPT